MGVFSGPADWWTDGTNEGRTHIATKGVIQDGIVLNLDAGASTSYPGSGTTWTDLSGNGNNGTLVGGVGYSADNGGSLVFDNVNDYISVSSISVSTFTYDGWVYHTPVNAASDFGYFFSGGNFGLAVSEGSGPPSIGQFYYYNSSTAVTLGYTLTPNVWTHVSAVIDGTGKTLKLFINGNEQSTTNVTNTQISITDFGRYQPGNTHFWNGRVSVARIYNKALTAAEVEQNYDVTKGRFGI